MPCVLLGRVSSEVCTARGTKVAWYIYIYTPSVLFCFRFSQIVDEVDAGGGCCEGVSESAMRGLGDVFCCATRAVELLISTMISTRNIFHLVHVYLLSNRGAFLFSRLFVFGVIFDLFSRESFFLVRVRV